MARAVQGQLLWASLARGSAELETNQRALESDWALGNVPDLEARLSAAGPGEKGLPALLRKKGLAVSRHPYQ